MSKTTVTFSIHPKDFAAYQASKVVPLTATYSNNAPMYIVHITEDADAVEFATIKDSEYVQKKDLIPRG